MKNLYLSEKTKYKKSFAPIFIKTAIVQIIIASTVTSFLVLGQIGPLGELSFIMAYNVSGTTYAGSWFNFGYTMYMIGVLAVSIMAILYKQFEINFRSKYYNIQRTLSILNLVLTNTGIVIVTWTMMIAGYLGGLAQLSPELGGKDIDAIQVHESIFQTIVPLGIPNWIGIWILITSLGIILGGIGFLIHLKEKDRVLMSSMRK